MAATAADLGRCAVAAQIDHRPIGRRQAHQAAAIGGAVGRLARQAGTIGRYHQVADQTDRGPVAIGAKVNQAILQGRDRVIDSQPLQAFQHHVLGFQGALLQDAPADRPEAGAAQAGQADVACTAGKAEVAAKAHIGAKREHLIAIQARPLAHQGDLFNASSVTAVVENLLTPIRNGAASK